MLFSSSVFLFCFLPIVLIVYYLLWWSRSSQNVFLCFASLFFYAWGEPKFVLIMMASIVVNWGVGLAVDRVQMRSTLAKLLIFVDVVVNLSIIFVFKYLGFFVTNVNAVLSLDCTVPQIALPIGISFFTFQAISYVVDVYHGKGKAQKNVLNVGLYISFFPQLIAGPIVRYETIALQIHERKENFQDFSDGVMRFIIGLGKKVIIANNMALVADKAFALSAGSTDWFGVDTGLSPAMAWLGALAYTFQIYYDFSGYSDMAIGLGKMFGFQFNENFNYPYISTSVTEFWRRWHISLSSWFRDYVYIPLGGSRVKTKARHIFNLFMVWLCTGVWHGANWTFIVWGLVYFLLLVIEKQVLHLKETSIGPVRVFRHIYVMFFVILLWVIFRADSLPAAVTYIQHMLSVTHPILDDPAIYHVREYGIFFILAVLFSAPLYGKCKKILDTLAERQGRGMKSCIHLLISAGYLSVFLLSISYIIVGSYNPFIYFNF